MTREEVIGQLKFMLEQMPEEPPLECDYIEEWLDTDRKIRSAFKTAIKAIEMVEEFEKAQIITGGRLNGRTYAYKCGLEDGKRKALEQEPCEDAVSRQAVIDALDKRFDSVPMEQTTEILLLRKDLRELPPVTPTHTETVTEFADRCRECGKQRKGKWVITDDGVCRCTVCGNGIGTKDKGYPFCHWCGADMREVNEDECMD